MRPKSAVSPFATKIFLRDARLAAERSASSIPDGLHACGRSADVTESRN
jgi:hypothetical protein